MKKILSDHSCISSKKLRLLVTTLGALLIMLLGLLRIQTEAQFTFASLMLLPVLANTWLAGRCSGWLAATLAALMWGYADLLNHHNIWWVPPINALVQLINYGVVVELAHKVQTLLRQETNNARVDKLTGVLNRRGFIEALEQQTQHAQRLGNAFAIAFIDLDQFKQLNDSQGHQAGDAALKAVGTTLSQTVRSTDVVGRVGGDEFCVMACANSTKDALDNAKRLYQTLAATLLQHPPVGASIGVIYFNQATLVCRRDDSVSR